MKSIYNELLKYQKENNGSLLVSIGGFNDRAKRIILSDDEFSICFYNEEGKEFYYFTVDEFNRSMSYEYDKKYQVLEILYNLEEMPF